MTLALTHYASDLVKAPYDLLGLVVRPSLVLGYVWAHVDVQEPV
jgi:hypothetical protein